MRWGQLIYITAIFILLLANTAFAANIDDATTLASIEDDKVVITSQYSTFSEKVEDIYIQLPKEVKSLSSSIDGSPRQCSIKKSIAFCGKLDNGKHTLGISYDSKESLGDLDERYAFRFTEYLPFRTKNHSFTLKLPIGSIIPSEQGKDPDFFLNPKPSAELSDGQRIMIQWKNENTNAVSVSAVIQPLEREEIDYQKVVLYLSGVIIAIMIVASISFIFTRRYFKRKTQEQLKKQKKAQKPKELVPQFIEHEQKVVELLQKAQNNELWQKQLLSDTKFSKAKLSRIIRNLEERGVITKTIYGNTNKISLKK